MSDRVGWETCGASAWHGGDSVLIWPISMQWRIVFGRMHGAPPRGLHEEFLRNCSVFCDQTPKPGGVRSSGAPALFFLAARAVAACTACTILALACSNTS